MIQIGILIKNRLKEDGRSVKWLAQKIQCKRRNIYDIFNRSSIDTAKLLRISLAMKYNFFLYFTENMIDKIEYALPNTKYCMLPQDEIRIGTLIKGKLEEEGRSVVWLAQKINCQRNCIYDLLKNKTSVDTTRLMKICKALKTNFFIYFIDMFNCIAQIEQKLEIF